MSLSPSWRSLAFRAYLRRLTLDDQPIVLGPWRSELGFEVLYWLPLLRWALTTYGIKPERSVALSRGGLGGLYPAAHHLDLYQLRGVDAVRLENQVDLDANKMLKQVRATPWDRAVAAEAVTRIYGKEQGFHLLHPSWMYWLFEAVWAERASLQHVAQHTEFSALPVPNLPEGFVLPKHFVAVRFYERHTFPFHPEVVTMAREMVQGLASQFPVVVLNQQLFADDHVDLPLEGKNIYPLPKVAPEQNLVMQAAVLARADAFVGTYGGMAQWALLYRKPSLSFYTQFGGTAMAHRTLSQILASKLQVPFEVADLRAMRLWKAALGPVVLPKEPEPEPEEVAA